MRVAPRKPPMIAALFSLPFVAWLLFVACDGRDGTEPGLSPTPATAAATATPVVATPTPPGTPAPLPEVTLEKIADGFARPTFVTHAGDGSGRLFVLEKQGRIRIIEDGRVLPEPFLDITSVVKSSGNEQGLLGLAFHPDYEDNGRFFVYYTAQDNDNTVAEYRTTSDASRADPRSGKELMAVADKFSNHNGGMLAFGPDGYLYIAMGDGGSAGDPDGNGQNLLAFLGKIHRIDVDGGDPYGIPESNPFIVRSSARGEIWAWGLRNPWRFSFDRETGDLWIADVGQNKYEEVNFQPAGSTGGENYGWAVMEGTHCFRPASGCDTTGMTTPIFEYSHGEGCSITGGYVYRGKAYPALKGVYLFTDYCSGNLWAARQVGTGKFETEHIGTLPNSISSFGEDEDGELYAVRDSEGAVYRVVAR
ncbi:MAG: PQQ-dependent sugar dehydrogenase [Dehalococcoidia bacterium]|nr:PQQ-dependent sugar dehydrogenase [Dehalococcoidia bacterium]